MKRYILLLLLIAGTFAGASAQSNVPFQLTSVHLKIPDDIPGIQADSPAWRANYYQYDFTAQEIKDTLAAELHPLKTSDKSTPWLTLQALLQAYQDGNLKAIKALYTKGSQSVINSALPTKEAQDHFLELVKQETMMRPYFAMDYDNGITAFVETRPGMVERFRFEKVKNEYFLAAYTEKNEPAVNNAYLYYLYKPKPHVAPVLLKGIDSLKESDNPIISFQLKTPGDWVVIFMPRPGTPVNLIAQDNGMNDGNTQPGKIDMFFYGNHFRLGLNEVYGVESNYPLYAVSDLMKTNALKFTVKVKK